MSERTPGNEVHDEDVTPTTVGQAKAAYEVMFVAVEECARILGLSEEAEGVLAKAWALALLDTTIPAPDVFGSYRASESGLGEDAGGRSKEHE